MTRDIQKILLFIVLILPTIVLLGLAMHGTLALKQAPSFILPITGYDPRDPIYGHYLQFRIEWPLQKQNAISCASDNPADCVVCVQDSGKPRDTAIVPVMTVIDKKAATQHCIVTLDQISYVRQAYTNSYSKENYPDEITLKNEPNRFYIDENHGKPLEDYFREHPDDFAIQAKIHNNSIHLEKLLINGRDYRETLSGNSPNYPRTPLRFRPIGR